MNRNKLVNIIKEGGTVCQFLNELVEVADQKLTNEILDSVYTTKSCHVITKEKGSDMGFNDLVDWSIESDLLICIDEYILVCIPKKCFVANN